MIRSACDQKKQIGQQQSEQRPELEQIGDSVSLSESLDDGSSLLSGSGRNQAGCDCLPGKDSVGLPHRIAPGE